MRFSTSIALLSLALGTTSITALPVVGISDVEGNIDTVRTTDSKTIWPRAGESAGTPPTNPADASQPAPPVAAQSKSRVAELARKAEQKKNSVDNLTDEAWRRRQDRRNQQNRRARTAQRQAAEAAAAARGETLKPQKTVPFEARGRRTGTGTESVAENQRARADRKARVRQAAKSSENPVLAQAPNPVVAPPLPAAPNPRLVAAPVSAAPTKADLEAAASLASLQLGGQPSRPLLPAAAPAPPRNPRGPSIQSLLNPSNDNAAHIKPLGSIS